MAFDVDGARQAGYSDGEIASHLAGTTNFDVEGARKAGYSDQEIIGHLTASSSSPPSAPATESGETPTAAQPPATPPASTWTWQDLLSAAVRNSPPADMVHAARGVYGALSAPPEPSRWPEAAVEAYKATPPILTPQGQDVVDKLPFGMSTVLNPVFSAGNVGLGLYNALGAAVGTGVKETAERYGVPRIGEDINTALQVAPMAHMGAGLPEPPIAPRVHPLMDAFDRMEATRAAEPPRGPSVESNIAKVQAQIGVRPEPAPQVTTPVDTAPPGVPPGTAVPILPRLQAAFDAEAAHQPPPRPDFVPSVNVDPVTRQAVPVVAPADRVPPGAAGPETVPYAQPAPDVPPSGAPSSPEAPGPQSAGAAASRDLTDPDYIAARTPTQALNDFHTSVTQTVRDRARPGATPGTVEDHAVYVPGVARLESARVFDPAIADNHDALRDIDPEYRRLADKQEQDNHDILKAEHSTMEGDVNSIQALREERANVSPDALKVFENERPVNAQPVVDTIRQILDGPNGKIDAVRNTLQRIEKGLYDKDGNLETLPSQLYGARKNLTTIRDSKALTQEAADAATSRRELGQVQTVMDQVIGSGANGYSDVYLPQWARYSRLIDQQRYLQSKTIGPGKITDADGNLTANGVQKLLEQIDTDKRKPGNNLAKSLTEEQLNKYIAIRNELAAMQFRDRLAKTSGSPTVKKAVTAARLGSPVMGHVRDLAVHTALLPTVGTHFGGLNALYQFGVKPQLEKGAALRRERKATTIMETMRNRLLNTNIPTE